MNHPTKSGGAKTMPIVKATIEQSVVPAIAPKRKIVVLVYHRDGVEVAPLAPGSAVVIGRSAPADVVVADERLSRQHARFSLVEGESVTVEDLGSLNGTWIGGERVERASIKPGEQVMLGTIAATVHVLSGDDEPPLGLEGHDAFVVAVDTEITRARFFGRPLAVLVVQAGAGEKGLLPQWCPRVRQLLRAVDRIGFYGAGVVEILLPESTLEEALALGRSIVARRDGEPVLSCGVAAFPESGSSAGTLLAAAREAARVARTDGPLRAAASALQTVISGPASSAGGDDAILESHAMRELGQIAARVARSTISVILRGETGSGKEVITRLIHSSGPRKNKPLVCVNCAAIPSQLVESTLFGHVKGAFTGAISDRKGVFEEADGGTLMLDEIGELPAQAQATLLRALETKRITRVGSTREITVNVRVIAATHRDLEAMADAGGFRSDLFFRLNGMEVQIPPLRARREDIGPLALRFLAREAEAAGRGAMTIQPEALALLERYAWPGNVRELRNTVERAVVIADGDAVTPRDLPERIRAGGVTAPEAAPEAAPAQPRTLYAGSLEERKKAFERDVLIAALRETAGHQTEAARLLDLPLRTFQHKIKQHKIVKQYNASDA
jgi:DNA-binding NtrC family response regulator